MTAQNKAAALPAADENFDIPLPSGAVIGFSLASFDEGDRLRECTLGSMRDVAITSETDIGIGLCKDLLCALGDNARVKAAVRACMVRCTYQGQRIVFPDTWTPLKAREDYVDAAAEIMRHNLRPFTKALSAQFRGLLEAIVSRLASHAEKIDLSTSSDSSEQATEPLRS